VVWILESAREAGVMTLQRMHQQLHQQLHRCESFFVVEIFLVKMGLLIKDFYVACFRILSHRKTISHLKGR